MRDELLSLSVTLYPIRIMGVNAVLACMLGGIKCAIRFCLFAGNCISFSMVSMFQSSE